MVQFQEYTSFIKDFAGTFCMKAEAEYRSRFHPQRALHCEEQHLLAKLLAQHRTVAQRALYNLASFASLLFCIDFHHDVSMRGSSRLFIHATFSNSVILLTFNPYPLFNVLFLALFLCSPFVLSILDDGKPSPTDIKLRKQRSFASCILLQDPAANLLVCQSNNISSLCI